MHRHSDGAVTQHRADAFQADTLPQHCRRCGMAQDVRAFAGRLNLRPLHHANHETLHGTPSAWRHKGVASQKYAQCFPRRTRLLDVSDQRITDFLRQRQKRRTARFARDGDPALRPIDMAELKISHLTGPQPEPCKQQKMARSRNRFLPWQEAISRSMSPNKKIHRLRAAAGKAGNGIFTPCRTLTCRRQITQEGACRRRHRFAYLCPCGLARSRTKSRIA